MKASILILLAAAALTLSGCDWVRGQLGMPTSKELQSKKARILAEDSIRRAKADSIAAALRLAADTAVVETPAVNLEYRYYVIVGAFEKQYNVDNMKKKFTDILNSPILVPGRDGLTMVAAAGFNTWSEAYAALGDVRPVVPEAWIYKAK